MQNKSIVPSSFDLITKLHDDSLITQRLIGMVADCAENAYNAEKAGQQGILSYKSVYGVLNHALEVLESMDCNTQLLWEQLRDLESLKSLINASSSLTANKC